MVVLKLSLWYDPAWRAALRAKTNWRRRKFWGQRKVTWTTGSYTFGPFRLDVNLTGVKPRG
jgi:hypothetical protein